MNAPFTVTIKTIDQWGRIVTLPEGAVACEYCMGVPAPATRTETYHGAEQHLCEDCWVDAFGDDQGVASVSHLTVPSLEGCRVGVRL